MRLRLIVIWPARLWLRFWSAVIFWRVLNNSWRLAWFKAGKES